MTTGEAGCPAGVGVRSPCVRAIRGSIPRVVARWWSFSRATGLPWG